MYECSHDGPCEIAIGSDRAKLQNAIDHAEALADSAVEPVTEEMIRLAREIVDRPTADGGCVEVTLEERETLDDVLGLAAEYMQINGYAHDPSFPEDQAAARLLEEGAEPITCCWTEANRRLPADASAAFQVSGPPGDLRAMILVHPDRMLGRPVETTPPL